MAEPIKQSEAIDTVLKELQQRGFPVSVEDAQDVQDAVKELGYTVNEGSNQFYQEGKKDPLIGTVMEAVSTERVVDKVGGYLLSIFPKDFQSEDVATAPTVEVSPSLLIEMEKNERNKEWDLEYTNLGMNLQAVDVDKRKEGLENYLAYVEGKHPQLTIPGKGNNEERKKYVDDFFSLPVSLENRIVEAVDDYAKTLRKLTTEADEEVAGKFAAVAVNLYTQLSPKYLSEFIGQGMDKVQAFHVLPDKTKKQKKAKQAEHQNIVDYFGLNSQEAKDHVAKLFYQERDDLITGLAGAKDDVKGLRGELARVNGEYNAVNARMLVVENDLTKVENKNKALNEQLGAQKKTTDYWMLGTLFACLAASAWGIAYVTSRGSPDTHQLREKVGRLEQDVSRGKKDYDALQDKNAQLMEQVQKRQTFWRTEIEREIDQPSRLLSVVEQYLQLHQNQVIVQGPGCENALGNLHDVMTGNGKGPTRQKFVVAFRKGPLCQDVDAQKPYVRFRR